MRVVGGRLRGRILQAPQKPDDPPNQRSPARVAVQYPDHGYGDAVAGARVLDLFAGTGALGIEALSRGAAFALFVDEGVEARALLRANVEALGLGGTIRIFRRDATRLGAAHPVEPFSLVFADPPYGRGLAEQALRAAHAGGWLMPQALTVVEEAADAGFAPPQGLQELERRAYDDTELIFLRCVGDSRASTLTVSPALCGNPVLRRFARPLAGRGWPGHNPAMAVGDAAKWAHAAATGTRHPHSAQARRMRSCRGAPAAPGLPR